MEILTNIAENLQRGDHEQVHNLTAEAIRRKIPPGKILDEGLLAGMAVIGEQFRLHEIFLPDVLLAAKAMYAGMDQLKPLLIEEEVPTLGKVVIGSVQGDMHDIGKNLVGIMLNGAGFEVIDLGNDVSPERFVDTAISRGASVIGMSALLTTTMPVMRKVVKLVKDSNAEDTIQTIIGGAPVSKDFAAEIGADTFGFDAANAVERTKKLLGVS